MLKNASFMLPRKKHYGYSTDLFSAINKIKTKDLPRPENVVIIADGLSKKYMHGVSEELYCFSSAGGDGLIMTIYERLSKTGAVFLFDKKIVEGSHFVNLGILLDDLKELDNKDIYVTFTGSATLCSESGILLKKIESMLASSGVKNIQWTYWHWIPDRWRLCFHHAWVVNINLKNGNVKTCEVPFNKMMNYILNKGLSDSINITNHRRMLSFINDFFKEPQHSKLRCYEKILKEKITPPKINHDCNFFSIGTRLRLYIFVYCSAELMPDNVAQLMKVIDSDLVDYTILYPVPVVLPAMPELLPSDLNRGASAAINFPDQKTDHKDYEASFLENKRDDTQGIVKRKAAKKDLHEKASPVTPASATHFKIVESEFFLYQSVVINSLKKKENIQMALKLQSICQDLQAGRLPKKTVEGYYVCDMPMVSGKKRGAWRLLIKREGSILTLFAIADYHGGRWKAWS